MNHAEIAARLPHRDAMCLLDRVLRHDAQSIECEARSHTFKPHPMADRDGRLGIANGIEYGAQAMALHAALTFSGDSSQRMPVGMLVGLRAVHFDVERLDDIDEPLSISARLVSGDARTAIYDLRLNAGVRPLLQARATVLIDAGERGVAAGSEPTLRTAGP